MTPNDSPETQDIGSAMDVREIIEALLGRLAALPAAASVEARDTEPLPERPGL